MNEKTNRGSSVVKSSCICICLNLALALIKYLTGTLSGSLSVLADAANNLSDAGTNLVTLIGGKLSDKPMDKEHPFGHGRMEYVSALAVSFLILHMAFDLCTDSVKRIFSPEVLAFKPLYVIAPAVSIAVKLIMALFSERLYKKTGNINHKAVRNDSLGDCAASLAVIAALFISEIPGVAWLDGVMGFAVGILVAISGIDVIKDAMGPLLGEAPKSDITKGIEERILTENNILGVHDIIVHDYGSGHMIASAHAEMPSDMSALELHGIIDRAEKHIEKDLGIIMCIHIDPVVTDSDVRYNKLAIGRIIDSYDHGYSFHDFRQEGNELFFEVIIPFGDDPEKAYEGLQRAFKEKLPSYNCNITIEHKYV